LFAKAQEMQLRQKLSTTCDVFRVSLYADDAVVFIQPTEYEMNVTNFILELFADASGLETNISKTHFYPIRCEDTNLDFLSNAGRAVSTFPCSYLGLPLCARKPSRAIFIPWYRKWVASCLAGKGTS
jgi:hypothetical protein